MLLFYQIATQARRLLVLSYPAVDEKGQDLLPGSFLQAVHACFRTDVVKIDRRRMLLDRGEDDDPLSAAEYRVHVAAAWPREWPEKVVLSEDLRANLADAAELARRRFEEKTHTPVDGLFRNPRVIAKVNTRFGPHHTFSPTALEEYVACPFRFFLRRALGLAPLEDPHEEIEVTRRGRAVHRALAQLHRRLKEDGVHGPSETVARRVVEEFEAAVEEDARRAPSPAAKELWRLEGRRLRRLAERYTGQWLKFVKPGAEKGVVPQPERFEIDFGLSADDGGRRTRRLSSAPVAWRCTSAAASTAWTWSSCPTGSGSGLLTTKRGGEVTIPPPTLPASASSSSPCTLWRSSASSWRGKGLGR
jgi:hypothetical protein